MLALVLEHEHVHVYVFGKYCMFSTMKKPRAVDS
jgi:hypothetical protein